MITCFSPVFINFYGNYLKINHIFGKPVNKLIMKYLTPEIAAFYKQTEITKSLARQTVSCGIFQDCDYNEDRPKVYQKKK